MCSLSVNNYNYSYPQYSDYYNQPQGPVYIYSDTRNVQDSDNSTKTVGMAALLEGVALLLSKASNWFADKLTHGKEFTTFDNVKKVADSMIAGNNLNVNVGYIDSHNKERFIKMFGPQWASSVEPVARGENAFFSKGLNFAVAPKSKPSLILHELGHAINASKGKLMNFMQNSRVHVASVPTALLLLNSILPKKDNEPSFIQKHAGLIGFGAFLPTIIEEGLASWRGVKAAKNVLGKNVNLAPLKRNYVLALCTYILAGLGLGVATKQAMLGSDD